MSSIVVAGDTSGSITIAAPAVAGSGTLTLPVATDTLVGKATTDTLTNKSIAATQLTGTIAASVLPAGSVLQVVSVNYSVETSNSTTTYADTGLTATITPTSATSKILILISHPECFKSSGNVDNSLALQILRGATVISFNTSLGYTNTTMSLYFSASLHYLDSPATTSATIYKTQFKNGDFNGALARVQGNNVKSTITLMEIAG